jgi:hypothetical protein
MSKSDKVAFFSFFGRENQKVNEKNNEKKKELSINNIDNLNNLELMIRSKLKGQIKDLSFKKKIKEGKD